MKTRRNYLRIPLVSAVFFLLGGMLFLHAASAATGQIYLSPGSKSVQLNSTFTLELRINPGANINGVQATVNYDAAKLQYISADTSGSAFDTSLPGSTASGSVTINRGSLSGAVSTDSRIEMFTFKALTSSGSSGVTLSSANASSSDNPGTYTNPSVGNATVSFTVPPCPTGQTGTYPNCVTPPPSGGGGTGGGSTGGGTTPPKTSTPKSSTPTPTTPNPTPTPSGSSTPVVNTSTVQYTSVSFAVTTTTASQVYVQYGLTPDALLSSTPPDALGTNHTVSLDPSLLIPGETYYYVVVAKDANGTITKTDTQHITTKGLTVNIGIFDKDKKPLSHKVVTLHSTPATATTDDKGFAIFSNVSPGMHHVSYKLGDKSYDQTVKIDNTVQTNGDTQTAAPQSLSIVYPITQSSNAAAVRIAVVALLLLAVGLGIFLMMRSKLRNAVPAGVPLTDQPVVVSDVSTQNTPPTVPQNDAYTTVPATPAASPLDTIQDPNKPVPGTTITPKDVTPTDPSQHSEGSGGL